MFDLTSKEVARWSLAAVVCLPFFPMSVSAERLAPPGKLYCEWQVNPAAMKDRCPEFHWEVESQTAYQILVHDSPSRRKPVWDSGKVETPLTIAEYDGEQLENGREYFWKLCVWSKDEASPFSPIQKFRTSFSELPHIFPHIRTMACFGVLGLDAEYVGAHYDLIWGAGDANRRKKERAAVKSRNPHVTFLYYHHFSQTAVGDSIWRSLKEFAAKGQIPEDPMENLFLHSGVDKKMSSPKFFKVAGRPMKEWSILGWDPRNDKNGDGEIDDGEFANLVNPKATARRKDKTARILRYWGNTQIQFFNVGDPLYMKFMIPFAKQYVSESHGLGVDACFPRLWGEPDRINVVEYPFDDRGKKDAAFYSDIREVLVKAKMALGPDKLIIGNDWYHTRGRIPGVKSRAVPIAAPRPFIIDGMLQEGFLNLRQGCGEIEQRLAWSADMERRGKIQLLFTDCCWGSPAGRELGVGKDRDRTFVLATYYLIHGDYTYFLNREWWHTRASGGKKPRNLWIKAVEHNIGKSLAPYHELARASPERPDWKILAREFEQALVLVKLGRDGFGGNETATTHKLDMPRRPLSSEGTLGPAVTEIALRDNEAAILVAADAP